MARLRAVQKTTESTSAKNKTPRVVPDAAVATSQVTNPLTDIDLDSQKVIHLQRTIGNQATTEYLTARSNSQLQRSDQDSEPTADSQSDPDERVEWWDVPFEGGTAYTYEEAMGGLTHVESFINDIHWELVPAERHEELEGIRSGTWPLMDKVESKEGELEAADAAELGVFSKVANDLWDSNIALLKQLYEPTLQQVDAKTDLEKQKKDLQEALHFAFIEGSDEAHIKAIEESISAVEAYKEKVDKVLGWAKDGLDKLKASKKSAYLEKLQDVSGKFGDVLGYAAESVEYAKIMYGLATGNGAGGDMGSINQFESQLAAIDKVMGFAKCAPILGQLWSSYYEPMAKECARMMKEIARIKDKAHRDYALMKWALEGEKALLPDGSPEIPTGLLPHFPGGQAVFSYMYLKCNGGRATLNSEIEAYFVGKADQFNAGVPDGGTKLNIESDSMMPGFLDFFGNESATNVDQFVAANQDMVWAMLYGSIPQDLNTNSS